MPRLCEDSAAKLAHRLEAAEAYLAAVINRRAPKLTDAEVEVVEERLLACEDFVTLSPIDWERVCAIVLPEKRSKAFRDYSVQTLALWSRVCETVAPEAYAGRPEDYGTAELPGSAGKEQVMRLRVGRGQSAFSPRDAQVGDDEGMVAQESRNGVKGAKKIDGGPTKRFLALLRGEGRQTFGADVEQPDPDWYKMRPPTSRAEAEPVVVVESKQGNPRKRKAKADQGGWLPFLDPA